MTSLLVVDIGNTTTKVGAWNGTTVESISVTPTRETASLLESLLRASSPLRLFPSSVSICSVVPKAEAAWLQWCKRNSRDAFVLRGDTPAPLVNRYRAPDRLGPDRLAAAVGAAKRSGAPVIVASLGTAVVVDAVSPTNEYLGGAIWVGMTPGLDILFERAAMLPHISATPPLIPIGGDTEACLLAGAFHGTASLIDGLALRMRAYMDSPAPLVLTGGDADVITYFLREQHEIVPHLTLIGTALIWEHNRGGEADAAR